MSEPEELKAREEKHEKVFEPLKAIGVFLSVFGVVIMIATYKPEDFWGKAVNLSSGIVLLGIGVFCFLLGLSRGRKAGSGLKDDCQE